MRRWLTGMALALLAPAVLATSVAPQLVVDGQVLLAQSADGRVRLVHRAGDRAAVSVPALTRALAPYHRAGREPLVRVPALAWEQERRFTPLDGFDYLLAGSARLSADGGTLAVGAGREGALDAWLIRRGQAPERMLPTAMARYSSVTDISADGRTVVGWLLDRQSVARGFLWRERRGVRLLPDPLLLPLAVSADGTGLLASSDREDRDSLRRKALSAVLDPDAALLPGDPGVSLWRIGESPTQLAAEGRALAYARLQGAVLWRTREPGRLTVRLGHESQTFEADALAAGQVDRVSGGTMAANGRALLLQGRQHSVLLTPMQKLPLPAGLQADSVTFSSDGRHVAALFRASDRPGERALRAWWRDLTQGDSRRLRCAGDPAAGRLFLSADGYRLTLAGQAGGYCVFDLAPEVQP